jgi:Rod binding domain-containing protein
MSGDAVVTNPLAGMAPPSLARFHGLDALPRAGQEAADVARRFEAIFTEQLVATMRATASGLGEDGAGGFFEGTGSDTYAAWFDQHMSEHLARQGGIGLASVILADLSRRGSGGSNR